MGATRLLHLLVVARWIVDVFPLVAEQILIAGHLMEEALAKLRKQGFRKQYFSMRRKIISKAHSRSNGKRTSDFVRLILIKLGAILRITQDAESCQ